VLSPAGSRRGTAIVEAAFVLPIFFMVVLGIVEFGRAMMVGQLVSNAARHGARLAIVQGSTNAEIETAVYDFLLESVGVSSTDVTVDITVTPAPGNPDPLNNLVAALPKDLCKVEVAVPYDKVMFVSGPFLSTGTLRGYSAMRHE
jgi:Flp pilus assembly protein TadG